MTTEEFWTLRRRDEVLGRITAIEPDFPWLTGRWSPTDAFREVQSLFAQELALLDCSEDWDAWEDVYRSIYAAGVRLHDPDGTAVAEYLLHIDGDDAWFRYEYEPFPADDLAGS